MARLTSTVRAHKRDVAELARLAEQDLEITFKQFNAPAAARDGLIEFLPKLVEVYGSAAATLGADWFDDLREQSGVRGRFTAIAAALPDRGRTDALARWAVTPLFAVVPDYATTLVKAAGGLQRIIANADRDTVRVSSVQDRRARGWARAGTGECEFCQMLIGRGAVYTEATADFQSHDRCGCVAVPEFD